jgi:hypothetical protein
MSERPRMGHRTDQFGDAEEPMADDPASDPGSDLEVLAITEEYVAAYRAGQRPRLSDFVVRYPAHAVALADFAAHFLPDEAQGEAEPPAEDEPASARPLSAGTRRALDALFGSMDGETAPAYEADSAPARLPSVAETPALYTPGGQRDTNSERPARADGSDAAAEDAAPARRPSEDAEDTGRGPGSR